MGSFVGEARKREINLTHLADISGAIINAYGEYLENNPDGLAIRDEKCLPYEKQAILNAFCFAIGSRGFFPAEKRGAMVTGALMLAYFQKDVGEGHLHPFDFDSSSFVGHDADSLDGEDLVKLIVSNPAGQARYDELLPRVREDELHIKKFIDQANALYEAPQPTHAHTNGNRIDLMNTYASRWTIGGWFVGLAYFDWLSKSGPHLPVWIHVLLIIGGMFAASIVIGGGMALLAAGLTKLATGRMDNSPNAYTWMVFISPLLAFFAAGGVIQYCRTIAF